MISADHMASAEELRQEKLLSAAFQNVIDRENQSHQAARERAILAVCADDSDDNSDCTDVEFFDADDEEGFDDDLENGLSAAPPMPEIPGPSGDADDDTGSVGTAFLDVGDGEEKILSVDREEELDEMLRKPQHHPAPLPPYHHFDHLLHHCYFH